MQTDDAIVRIRVLGGSWEVFGADRARGIWPENLTCSTNTWGNDKASFDLRRDPATIWPDLNAFNEVEIEIGGLVVWTGRISETPARDGDDPVINVQCEGWQYHLDDDSYAKLYVHSNLSDFRDMRTMPGVDVQSLWRSVTQVAIDQGVITIGYPNAGAAFNGSPVMSYAGVILDLGPNNTAASVAIDYLSSNNMSIAGGSPRIVAVGLNSLTTDPLAGVPNNAFSPVTNNASAGQTLSGTFTTPSRYVLVYAYFSDIAAEYRFSIEVWWRITGIRVFGSNTYRSGSASILKASDVISDARAQAAPLLSSDTSRIAATSFSIPDMDFALNPRTPREAVEAVNAFHNYMTYVDTQKRLTFQPRPSDPLFEIGAWGGSTFTDSAMNSGQAVYDQVHVTGTGPDGVPFIVKRTQTGTVVDKQGFHRTMILPISAPLTTAVANQIGDVWLASHRTQPLRGSITVQPEGMREVRSGRPVHPSELLRAPSQLIRLSHRIDPDTGALGREGTIASVSYTHNTRTASVEIDSDRRNFESLLARYATIQSLKPS